MGYDVRLLIGETCNALNRPEWERETEPKIDNGYLWYPYKKDAKDNYIETGRVESIFMTVAMVELCKTGYSGAVMKLIEKTDKEAKANTKLVYKWYRDGNTLDETDCYGAKKIPIAMDVVIAAIQKDNKGEGYRRFDWALGLLNAMQKTSPNEFQVILYGH
jgi:hypothetical protein